MHHEQCNQKLKLLTKGTTFKCNEKQKSSAITSRLLEEAEEDQTFSDKQKDVLTDERKEVRKSDGQIRNQFQQNRHANLNMSG